MGVNKLKVGVVLNTDQMPHNGGAFSYYSTLINAIDNFHFNNLIEIVFINFGEKVVLGYNKEILDVNIQAIKRRSIKYLSGRFFYKLLLSLKHTPSVSNEIQVKKYFRKVNSNIEKKLNEERIDLLYYLVPTIHHLNYPFIMTHWDLGHKSMYAFPEVSMNNSFEWRNIYHQVLQKAFAIFAESKTSKIELNKYESINSDRIFVVPLFAGDIVKTDLNPEHFTQILKKFNLNPNNFFFYPAQFWSHKNHSNLLLAFRKCVDKYPGIKLVFSGSDKGNLEYIYSVIKELELQEDVIISGFIEAKELFCFYKQAIALVMPTFLGPTNMPLIEAYELGCKVVCSDLIGHRELLEDEAVYFDPVNADNILKSLEYVINIKNWEPKSKGRFSVDNSVKEIDKNLCALVPIRRVFGHNYNQY